MKQNTKIEIKSHKISHVTASRTQMWQKCLAKFWTLWNRTFPRSTLTLRRADSDIFEIEALEDYQKETERGQYHLGEGITGEVAKSGVPELVLNINKDKRFLNRTKSRSDIATAFICVPIIHMKEIIGTMSIDLPTHAPESELREYMRFLELVANLVAEAVANIRSEIEERDGLMQENERLRRQLGDRYSLDKIVGNCSSMRTVYEQIAQVADSAATVLVRGESGTGKELVAQAILYNSPRKNNPFISINCAALPDNLIESELFGHEKGSFTGATAQRKGRFELANSGTIFSMKLATFRQRSSRLLRVLQERSFERVGGNEPIKVNVRVIAATSRNLEEEISKGNFREDLYYRLNVFPIFLPPVRERRSDIILLADHFLHKYNEMYQKAVKRISTSAINMMMTYHWPGNVRELENCMERAVLTSSDSAVHGYNLPPSLQTSERTHTAILPEAGADLKTLVESYEKEIIIDALKRFRGNCAGAARYLHTTQRIINYRIKSLGIEPRQYK